MAELTVVPEGIDAELSLLIEGIEDPAQRSAVIRAVFDMSRGQPDSFTVKFAILVKALTSMVGNIPVLVKKTFRSETKELRTLLAEHQRALKESHKTASEATTQVQGLAMREIADLKKVVTETDAARKKDTEEMARKLVELQVSLPNVYEAAKIVRDVHSKAVWSWIAIAAVAGVLATLAFEFFALGMFQHA